MAWKAYLAELAAMQMAEHPSEAIIAERVQEYLNRLAEATRILSEDSSRLPEVLIEILELVTGEAEIVGWRPVALWEARKRIAFSPRPVGRSSTLRMRFVCSEFVGSQRRTVN